MSHDRDAADPSHERLLARYERVIRRTDALMEKSLSSVDARSERDEVDDLFGISS